MHMHYIDKNGLVLEILQTGERLFNGQPCVMKREENNTYSICIDDCEFSVKLGVDTFEILESNIEVKPYVEPPKPTPIRNPSNKDDLNLYHKVEKIEIQNHDIKVDFKVDGIYLINMESRVDRYVNSVKQIRYFSKSFYKVTPIKPEHKDWFSSVNTKSCYLAHHWCMKHAIENSFKRVLILEDDFIIDEKLFSDYQTIQDDIKNINYDIIFFYKNYNNVSNSISQLVHFGKTWLAHFYVVNNIAKVLNWNEKDYKPGIDTVDHTYSNQHDLITIVTNYQYVAQANTYSDLWKHTVRRFDKSKSHLIDLDYRDKDCDSCIVTVAIGKDCNKMAQLQYKSLLYNGNYYGDWHVITDMPDIYKNLSNCIAIKYSKSKDIFHPAHIRLHLNEFVDFKKYRNVLYLDSDILCHRHIDKNEIFCASAEVVFTHENFWKYGNMDRNFEWAKAVHEAYLSEKDIAENFDKYSINSGSICFDTKIMEAFLREWVKILNSKNNLEWYYDQPSFIKLVKSNAFKTKPYEPHVMKFCSESLFKYISDRRNIFTHYIHGKLDAMQKEFII